MYQYTVTHQNVTFTFTMFVYCYRVKADTNWFGGQGSVKDLANVFQHQIQEVSDRFIY